MKPYFFLRYSALLIALFAIAFSACKKDAIDDMSYSFSEAELAEIRTSTCMTIDADAPYDMSETPENGVEDRAGGKKNRFWSPGKKLRVKFLNGSSSLKSKVFSYAKQWEDYANVDLVRVYSGTAEIRVSFNKDGHWSYMGKDNLGIPSNKSTMNLEFTNSTPNTEVRRTTLHEFGHALGLRHEHQSPMANIPWNKEAVYAFYYQTMGWSKQKVDHNVLNKYSWESSQHTSFDAKSIMEYPVNNNLTINNYSIGWNTKLSTKDKDFISKIYSKKRFRVRHAANTNKNITFWLNGIYHTLKPGESLWVPAYASNNHLAIWECVYNNCGWDSYGPPYGKNYRIVTQGSGGNLALYYD